MDLDNSKVKEYFAKEKTVSRWWDPEDKPGLFRDLYLQQRRLLAQLFDTKGKKVLDAGTGKGRFAIGFAIGGARKVVATDLSSEMLAIAEQRARREGVTDTIEFRVMDIENLTFENDSFDAVACMETFVHLPSPQRAMNELARVVKPGGTVVASVTLPATRGWYRNIRKVSSLGHLFEWLFTPVYESRFYQVWIRRIIGRPPLVGRPLPAEFFEHLFAASGLTIQRRESLGHPRSPRFLMVLASKVK